MDEKKLKAIAAELNIFSLLTLKHRHWTVSKLCGIIENTPKEDNPEYKLQPDPLLRSYLPGMFSDRDIDAGAPTPEVEARIMQILENCGFFKFKANWSNPEPDLRFELGWLAEYDLPSLNKYLEAIGRVLADKEQGRVKSDYLSVPSGWKWFDKEAGKYQFGEKGIFEQTGDKVRKKVFQALMDIFEKSPQGASVASISQRTGVKPERLRIEIDAINTRLSKQIGIYFKGTGKGYYMIENYSPTKSSSI